MRTFFIADTHFRHANVIAYENRPYANTDEMDADLIKRWNETVRDEDVVWMLGDFTLTTNKEYITNIVRQLKGHKRLIMGNHDHRKPDFYISAGFEFVSRYPVVYHQRFILSHEPLPEMETDKTHFYIYGHVHGSPLFQTHTDNSQCVSCERTDYRPIRIKEVDEYQPAPFKNFDAEGNYVEVK